MQQWHKNILAISSDGTLLRLRLDTDTRTEIELDMTAFLENGRKFLNFTPADLAGCVETDGTNVTLRLNEETMIELTYSDIKALTFNDPIAVSEKVFMLAPGADPYQVDLDALERSGYIPKSPDGMTKIKSAAARGNILEYQMDNAANPVIRLDMTAFLKRAQKLCPFDAKRLLEEVSSGGMKIYLCLHNSMMAELYWNILMGLTFDGESEDVAESVLAFVQSRWKGAGCPFPKNAPHGNH